MTDSNLSLADSVARAANRILDLGDKHRDEIEKTIEISSATALTLKAATARLEKASEAIPRTLKTQIEDSLSGVAESAETLLAAKFADIDQKAGAIAERYEGAIEDYEAATKMLRWSVMIPVGIFCIVVSAVILGGAYLAIHSLTPSNEEIQHRRNLILQLDGEIVARQASIKNAEEKVDRLNKKVQALRRAGGTLKLEECTDAENQSHLCIRIADNGQWVQRFVDEVRE